MEDKKYISGDDICPGPHQITSNNQLCCGDTGRVIAVFYNDYDLDEVLEVLNKDD